MTITLIVVVAVIVIAFIWFRVASSRPILPPLEIDDDSPGRQDKGGFTMRVMFDEARKQWGEITPELRAEEAKYVE